MKARQLIISVFLVACAFSVGYGFGVKGFEVQLKTFPKVTVSRITPPEKNLDFSLFWKVWDNLSNSYYDKSKVVESQMVYGAIKGLTASLGDPYTVFLTPSENKTTIEDLQGNFEGVGIQIGFKGDKLAVIAPLPKSPAENVGIKAGDYIVGIKDDKKGINRNTIGISLPEAVSAIRGARGTKVTLMLLRDDNNEPFEVEVTRGTIDVPSVVLTFEGDNKDIAHIKLLKFGGETTGEWAKIIAQIASKSDIKGVILDLRNNPGGYLQGAVEIASEFLPAGSVAVIEEKGNGQQIPYKTTKSGILINNKVVVLLNQGSASASEILAGALRDNRKIQIIGEKSFGKGTVQEPQDLDGGAGIHVTIAKWLTPNGTWVNGKGLEPDIKIETKADDKDDKVLLEALKQISNF